jgi:MFS family permease
MLIQRKNSAYAWIIWALAALFFFSEYFARVAPSVMVTDLMRAFNVHALSLGALSAAFYYGYVGMQLPVGALMDRFGPRCLLTVMAMLCGVSCLVFAHSHDLGAAASGRFFMGFSAAFAFVGALKLASLWFPAERLGFMTGFTQALGMLGAAMGEGPVSGVVATFGWRQTMEDIGIILIILAVLIGLIVRDHPRDETTHRPVTTEPIIKSLHIVIKNPQTWVNGLVVGFLYAPTAAFAELWGPDYFHRVSAIDLKTAASIISAIFIGWGISSPLIGMLSDRLGRRKPIVIGSVVCSGVLMGLALYLPHTPVWLLFTLMFLYGVSNVGVATCYAIACEQNTISVGGTSMAFANMASVLVGALFQPIIGWLLDLNWGHHFSHGVPFYSAQDFHHAMLALPACFIISLVACLFLKETSGHTLVKQAIQLPVKTPYAP